MRAGWEALQQVSEQRTPVRMALLRQAQQDVNASPILWVPVSVEIGLNATRVLQTSRALLLPTKPPGGSFPFSSGITELMETQALVEPQLWCPSQHTSTSQNGGTADKSTKRWTAFEHLPPRLCSTSSSHWFCSCHLVTFKGQVWAARTAETKRYTGWEGDATSGGSFW